MRSRFNRVLNGVVQVSLLNLNLQLTRAEHLPQIRSWIQVAESRGGARDHHIPAWVSSVLRAGVGRYALGVWNGKAVESGAEVVAALLSSLRHI